MVQFRVLELIFTYLGNFTMPELSLYLFDLHEIKNNN